MAARGTERFCALCALATLHRFANGGPRARRLHQVAVGASRIVREAFLLAPGNPCAVHYKTRGKGCLPWDFAIKSRASRPISGAA